jgi:VanZ family protein
LIKIILTHSISLITFSVVLVLIATLYPFNFDFNNNLSVQTIIANFDHASSFADLVNNILLFVPLGFSSTAFLWKIKIKPVSKIFTLIIISFGLSLIVEILQMFLPSRTPTPADLINNTIGGIVGMICFYIWHSQSFISIWSSLKNSSINNSSLKITLLLFGYILLSFLILIPWQAKTHLSNWDLTYPLIIGNEKTGDKPWHGYIHELHIADQAFSQNDVLEIFKTKNYLNNIDNSFIASYQLTDETSYQDRTGKIPKLVPSGQLTNIVDGKGVALGSNYWLKTGTPAKLLSESIRKNSQFTIITKIATADTTQTGPARIISLSSGILHRNFTLGQQGTNLDLRLRTLITGENGTDIKLSIPGIFTTTNSHYIMITYSQGNLKVYIDKLENFYSFNLIELIPKEQKLLYYALSFIPLGIGLTFLTILSHKKLSFNRVLLPSGIILPPLILEISLAINTGKNISLTNILIGIFFIGGTLLILRLRASVLVPKTALK